MEVRENVSDMYEVSVPAKESVFCEKEKSLQKLSEKHQCDFLGYDEFYGIIDISWENGFPESDVMSEFATELAEILA